MNKAEERALEAYPSTSHYWNAEPDRNVEAREFYKQGYHQAEKDVAEAFARIIRGNLRGIGNGIQNMFEQLYTDITGEKMYKGFKD